MKSKNKIINLKFRSLRLISSQVEHAFRSFQAQWGVVGLRIGLLPLFLLFHARRTMAGKWLPAAELTASGRPVLCPGEIESYLLSSVDLHSEENPNFPYLKSGILILTTHRLLWIADSAPGSATAVSVPLAAIKHIFSLKKSIKSMFASPRIRFQVSASPDGRVDVGGYNSSIITLVMRGKNDHEAFVSKFWDAWRARAWETENSSSGSGAGGSGSREGESGWSSTGLRLAGVSGILRKEQEMWESTDKSLQEAFQDLNALMVCVFYGIFCLAAEKVLEINRWGETRSIKRGMGNMFVNLEMTWLMYNLKKVCFVL